MTCSFSKCHLLSHTALTSSARSCNKIFKNSETVWIRSWICSLSFWKWVLPLDKSEIRHIPTRTYSTEIAKLAMIICPGVASTKFNPMFRAIVRTAIIPNKTLVIELIFAIEPVSSLGTSDKSSEVILMKLLIVRKRSFRSSCRSRDSLLSFESGREGLFVSDIEFMTCLPSSCTHTF